LMCGTCTIEYRLDLHHRADDATPACWRSWIVIPGTVADSLAWSSHPHTVHRGCCDAVFLVQQVHDTPREVMVSMMSP